ncbi:dimethylsulfonioproprionate lyase family protein [Roseovarius sp. EL26]|uniref:dimethylsulfonioproprionate lyase family protein n=1 Tax=Roseovarius sp. EL26 TaxID=2126672 RepID=UPI000EA27EA0|nr:dimethylsulfonioproprionate lyase family protein [Roseovarius sp. EL26]
MNRAEYLQDFLDALKAAFQTHVTAPTSKRSLATIFEALETSGSSSERNEHRLPVCKHLDQALAPLQHQDAGLQRVGDTFRQLEPKLNWRKRDGDWTGASDNFADSHANALIMGPAGLERRTDVWIGVTLLAPHVRYPDHCHPPEETYLVISDGVFRNDEADWCTLGPGGSFFNPPGITHAMRSDAKPLLAFWVLNAQPSSFASRPTPVP